MSLGKGALASGRVFFQECAFGRSDPELVRSRSGLESLTPLGSVDDGPLERILTRMQTWRVPGENLDSELICRRGVIVCGPGRC